jgi:hypothetical protein
VWVKINRFANHLDYSLYRVFQNERYNFASLYKVNHRTCTVFWTVIMYQNTPSFTWDRYGSMRLPLVSQGVSKRALQWYSKCYCVASLTKTFTLKGVHSILECWIVCRLKSFLTLATQFGIPLQSPFWNTLYYSKFTCSMSVFKIGIKLKLSKCMRITWELKSRKNKTAGGEKLHLPVYVRGAVSLLSL